MKAKELKATDLMVGDWVMLNDKPYQVKGLHNDDTATFIGCRSAYYLVDAEPIPITPEILEKNGFEKAEDIQLYYYCLGIDDRVSIHDYAYDINSSNTWHVHIDSEDYSTIANCELTYVHQLQHILRLCEIDKEIKV